MKMTYAEQLRHPNWQRRRLDMLSAENFACSECGATDKTLHVHHRRYVKGRMAWEYSKDELHVLCEDCHSDEHANRELLEQLLMHMPTAQAVALIGGYLSREEVPDELLDAAQNENPNAFAVGWLSSVSVVLRLWQIHDLTDEAFVLLHANLHGPRVAFDAARETEG